MIWIVLIIVALATLLILAPAFVGPVQDEGEDVQVYFDQIEALEADPDLDGPAKATARLMLERQILRAQKTDGSRMAMPLLLFCAVCLFGGGAALYAQVGNPSAIHATISEDESLLRQLEERLATDRKNDPLGWALYGRALASLGRTQEALLAYDQSLRLEENSDVRAEAMALVRGPTQADVDAAMAMSEVDRAAMVRGMVDSLAARLTENPQDAPGWTRLIRARIVLGDDLDADIRAMRAAYSDRPAVADQILREAGYEAPRQASPD